MFSISTSSISDIMNVVSTNSAFEPIMVSFSLIFNLPLFEKVPMNIKVSFSFIFKVLS